MIGHRRILMGVLILALASAGILLSAPAIARADEVDADKLVGTWVLTTLDGKPAPTKLEFTFAKKGEASNSLGQKGTYKLDGNKLTIRMTARVAGAKGKKPVTSSVTTSWMIAKLTEDVLVITGKSGGSESEFKKKMK
jgi:uncharacterized protein (TIGR03066 family)